jgi:tRNA G37 N-methylase Trm5
MFLTSYLLFVDDVLKEIIPFDPSEIPSGYETVGDIAHLNLSEKLMKYKKIIG